jgi:hypothetical protein
MRALALRALALRALALQGVLNPDFFTGTTGRFVDDTEEKIRKMLKHYQEHIHNKYNGYAFGFFCCELLNPCLSLISIYMTHKFLFNQYLNYGLDVYR